MPLRHLSREHIREILMEQNRWKSYPAEISDKAFPEERPLSRFIAPAMLGDHGRLHHVLLGPRRTGKTTILWQTIRHLLNEGVPQEQIFYLQMDHPEVKRETLDAVLAEIRELSETEGVLYVAVDEIGADKEWGNWLKYYWDQRSPFRIFASSSNSPDPAKTKNDSGTGRWAEHYLLPCNFLECLEFMFGPDSVPLWCRSSEDTLFDRLSKVPTGSPVTQQMEETLATMLLLSGYPSQRRKAGNFPVEPEPRRKEINRTQQHLNEIAERVVYKDIVRSAEIRDTEKLEDLLHVAAGMISKLGMPGEIGNTVGIANTETAKAYFGHLQRVHLMFRLRNYSDSPKGTATRNEKFYFHDTAMAYAITASGGKIEQDSQQMGYARENLAAAALQELRMHSGMSLNFWRKGNNLEADFVFAGNTDQCLAFEIGSRSDHGLVGLKKFQESKPRFVGRAYLVTPSSAVVSPEHTGIGEMPLALFLLAVNAQSTQAMLERGGILPSGKYRVTTPTKDIYPKYGLNKPSFSDGDILHLTEYEATPHLAAGTIEEARGGDRAVGC